MSDVRGVPDQLTEEEVAAVRAMLDRDAIRECVNLYFHALDTRVFDLLDRVFAPEVEFGGRPGVPREVLKEQLAGVMQFRVSHHGPRNSLVTVLGDRAHADTYAMDTLLIDEAARDAAGSGWPVHDRYPGALLRFHGLRYVDDLERRPEGWRIVRRHGPLVFWRYHATGVEVHPDVDAVRAVH